MQAIYYARKRDQGYHEKPMLGKVFAFIADVEAEKKFIKTLLFTKEEMTELETEIRALAADVNFWKLKDATVGIAKIIGYRYEIMGGLTVETTLRFENKKIDKRR